MLQKENSKENKFYNIVTLNIKVEHGLFIDRQTL